MKRRDFLLGASLVALTAGSAPADTGFYQGYPRQITGWTAQHFAPREFASKGNGKLRVTKRMVAALDRVRDVIGRPIRIISGYRDPEHNARVGGAKYSRHLISDAVDINLRGMSAAQRYTLMWHLLSQGFTSFGSYARSTNMLHADMRQKARVWRHGDGRYPSWFRQALADWGWTRDRGPTRVPQTRLARK